MKRFKLLFPTLLLFLSATIAPAVFAERISDISNTKHNLSTSGPGPAKAVSESQICVFCHIPHNAENIPGAPLWNRQDYLETYTPYTSTTIDANDIAATPGGSSKLCLSCHDGTIALGSVNMINGQTNVTINMTGTGPGGVMPSGQGDATGFTRKLGTDLSNDHPISFTYNSALANADGELRDPAAVAHIATRVPGIKPEVPLENDQLQCTSCHDPHIRDTDPNLNIKFLRLHRFQQAAPGGGAFNTNIDMICLACHDKLGTAWSSSAHAAPLVADETYTTAAANLREFPDGLPVWRAGCLNCHDTHAVQGTRRLLREGTDGPILPLPGGPKSGGEAAQEEACYTCHSSDGGVLNNQGSANFQVPDIKTDFTTGVTHMPITTSDQQALSEVHEINNADMLESSANLNNQNRHVECSDCHNPHRVVKNRLFNNTGNTAAGTHNHAAGHRNIASGVLRGSWGVEPVYGDNRFDPDILPINYQVKSGDGGDGANTAVGSPHVTREYQVCLKCHSDYAYGTSPPFLGDSGGNTSTLNSNGLTQYTNQAVEFQAPGTHKGQPLSTIDSGADPAYSSFNHRSWHPVMDNTGRNLTTRNANANKWLPPWNGAADVGNQTMYCSDCHGSDTAQGTSAPNGGENGNPWGPHGSSNKFILKGDWRQETGEVAGNNDLCFKCHNYNQYTSGGGGNSGFGGPDRDTNLHAWHAGKIDDFRCTWCHVAVPHGFKNKALLVNLNDVGPEGGFTTTGNQVRNNTTAGYNNPPYYLNAKLKVINFAESGEWVETDCGSAGNPGNGQNGQDWMRDSNENCANPP